jgi:hypothetical protein
LGRKRDSNPFGFGSIDFGLGRDSRSKRKANNDNPFGVGSLDLGGGFGFGSSSRRKKQAPQDCHNYTLRKGHKEVYTGISNDPERRIREHRRDGKKFDSATVSRACSRDTAREREKEKIDGYENSHGRKPRYNKVT